MTAIISPPPSENANGPGNPAAVARTDKSKPRQGHPYYRDSAANQVTLRRAPRHPQTYLKRWNSRSEVSMPQMTPQASEVLEKALALSTQDRGLIIDRLIENLDNEPAEEGVEEAWSEEIKRRVDDIKSGRVEMIPGEEVHRRLLARLSNGKK
jgi:putative addiction module component (TIGR02574 family)